MEHLEQARTQTATMIFYEAPHKLCATLRDMLSAFGDRRVTLARELTKLHEQVHRTTLAQAVQYYEENPPRGEFVLTIEGAPDEPDAAPDEPARLTAAAEAVRLRMADGQTQKDAIKAVSAQTGVKKNALYRYVLEQDM